MGKKRETRERVLRCQRLLALGAIAGLMEDRKEQKRYLRIYRREFNLLPPRLRLTQEHDAAVVRPARELFDRYGGPLGVQERAVNERWRDEFAD
jgi:hypothetical protein